MSWKKLLVNVTGSIGEELRLRNEYLVTENRILRSKIERQLRLKVEERRQLATIGIIRISWENIGCLLVIVALLSM